MACDLNAVLSRACQTGIDCLETKRLLVIIAQSLCTTMNCDLAAIQQRACESGIGRIDSNQNLLKIIAQLLCDMGGVQSTCITCGFGDPTEDATCDCSIYYNKTDSTFWYWDPPAWFKFG